MAFVTFILHPWNAAVRFWVKRLYMPDRRSADVTVTDSVPIRGVQPSAVLVSNPVEISTLGLVRAGDAVFTVVKRGELPRDKPPVTQHRNRIRTIEKRNDRYIE